MSDQDAAASVGADTEPPPDDPSERTSVAIHHRPASHESVAEGRALDLVAERTPGLTPMVPDDDVTDEDAFRASTARGGTAVLVADAPRGTAASHRLRDPEAVASFLVAMARAEN